MSDKVAKHYDGVVPDSLGITEFDWEYESGDEVGYHGPTPSPTPANKENPPTSNSLKSTASSPARPTAATTATRNTAFAEWYTSARNNKKRKNPSSSDSSPAPPSKRINYHRAEKKICVGSRVSKRIGEQLDNDVTAKGTKRRVRLYGTVIESVGRLTWKIKFDTLDEVKEYKSSQLKFEHNDFIHQNVLKTKVRRLIIILNMIMNKIHSFLSSFLFLLIIMLTSSCIYY